MRRDSPVLDRPKSNYWTPCAMLAVIGCLIYMMFNDDWQAPLTKRVEIVVYLNAAQCENSIVPTLRYQCTRSAAFAAERANNMVWPYQSKQRCETDFGMCRESTAGYYRPFDLGFAIITRGKGDYLPTPVFYAQNLNQYVLAPGYPVVIGKNALPFFSSDQQFLINTPGALSYEICFALSTGENFCTTRAQLLASPGDQSQKMLLFSAAASPSRG